MSEDKDKARILQIAREKTNCCIQEKPHKPISRFLRILCKLKESGMIYSKCLEENKKQKLSIKTGKVVIQIWREKEFSGQVKGKAIITTKLALQEILNLFKLKRNDTN